MLYLLILLKKLEEAVDDLAWKPLSMIFIVLLLDDGVRRICIMNGEKPVVVSSN